ncbi:sulfite oxidase [Microvirga massiliensis]|uniref:sulfite oxidase n=1 Tax=Microvirga massiliensis TaxID=1033741 RepID=UPI00062B6CDB|nr:sulfite oxidase [Microvirga massiliensis]
METVTLPRRDFLAYGSAAVAGWTALRSSLAHAFPSRPGEEVIPWADQPPPIPDAAASDVQNLARWEDLNSWLTPNERFFSISHYNRPVIDAASWSLQIGGESVAQPLKLTLEDIKARPRREVVFTLECSGNHGHPWFTAAVGNARWAGTPLAPILEEAQVRGSAREVVFFGTDAGEEEVRNTKVRQNFARSMSLDDAMSHDTILAYEMNGAPLPQPNGFPLRLIAPGWYGIANVKWLERIEVRDSRFMGRFQARDYVTLREEQHDGKAVNIETSVGRALLKSAPAKVTRQGDHYRIVGAAWGAPIARVEVQIDDGPWVPATIDRSEEADHAWRIWSLDWERPSPGEHRITSRATDFQGHVQPAMNDPWIANKRTYWESNGQVTRSVRVS